MFVEDFAFTFLCVCALTVFGYQVNTEGWGLTTPSSVFWDRIKLILIPFKCLIRFLILE